MIKYNSEKKDFEEVNATITYTTGTTITGLPYHPYINTDINTGDYYTTTSTNKFNYVQYYDTFISNTIIQNSTNDLLRNLKSLKALYNDEDFVEIFYTSSAWAHVENFYMLSEPEKLVNDINEYKPEECNLNNYLYFFDADVLLDYIYDYIDNIDLDYFSSLSIEDKYQYLASKPYSIISLILNDIASLDIKIVDIDEQYFGYIFNIETIIQCLFYLTEEKGII